jgi:hypothetical protein
MLKYQKPQIPSRQKEGLFFMLQNRIIDSYWILTTADKLFGCRTFSLVGLVPDCQLKSLWAYQLNSSVACAFWRSVALGR